MQCEQPNIFNNCQWLPHHYFHYVQKIKIFCCYIHTTSKAEYQISLLKLCHIKQAKNIKQHF